MRILITFYFILSGLTVAQSTDIKILTQVLSKLGRQLKELNLSYRTRFLKKETLFKLKGDLDEKVRNRDQLVEDTEQQKLRRMRLKTAVETAQAYLKIQPPHQTIGDVVISALTRQSSNLGHEKGKGSI